MTALLTDNLPLLAGAPNGIKKLRELILELAVRGKLVPQDPSDEPASELLKRIAAEKARLVAEGKLKKQKPLAEITNEERPFELPAGWEWSQLGRISSDVQYGFTASANHQSGEPLLLRITDIQNDGVNWDTVPGCEISPSEIAGYELKNGDIVIARTGGTIGKSYLVSGLTHSAVFASYLIRIGRLDAIYPDFTKVFLGSQFYWKQLYANSMGTGQPNVNGTALKGLLIPLAPMEEQHRIVAKVDELMALCDRLEAQQTDAESAHSLLVQALLDNLTQTSDPTDFAANWQRLAEHFHTLFTTESSIDALKQTLLQLAVMGKLVQQDPDDEPASELLRRIAVEKSRLVAQGKVKKQKPRAEIGEEEKPFELPKNWVWSRLGSQVIDSGAGWSPSCESRPREGLEWGVLKVSAVSWGAYNSEENKALPANLEARPEHEVAEGDFLVSRANTAALVARSVVVEKTPSRLMLSDKIVRLKLTDRCDRRYVNLVNSAPHARQYYAQVAGGTSSSMKNVSREQILNLPIALPPLAEQQRIVAKVDQLMHLCNTFKQQITAANGKQTELLSVLMAEV